jgi:serine/threonine protein kinase
MRQMQPRLLQHAAIVSTVDLGRDGDILYIAMELVRGPSLTARIADAW